MAQIYDDHLWAILIIIFAIPFNVPRMISDFLGCVTWVILVCCLVPSTRNAQHNLVPAAVAL